MAEEITLEQRLKQDAEERYQNAVRNAENVMIRTGKLTEEANAALDATTQELRDLGYDNNQLRQLYQDVSVENVQAKDKTEQFIIDAIDGVFDRRTPAMVAAEDEYRQAQQDVLEHSITHARGNEEQLEGLLQELEPLEVLRDQAEQVLREQHGYGDQEIDWLNAEAEQKVAARMSDLMMETVIELDESELEEMTDDNKLEMFQKAPGMTEDEAREAFIATEIAINDLITSAGDDPEELSNEMFITVTRTIPGDLRRQRMDVIETLRDDYGYQPEDFAALRQEVQQQAVEDEIIIDEQNPLTEDEAREQFITTEIAMADHDPNNIPQDIRDQQREAIQLLRENFNYEPADFDAMREEAQQWIAQQDTPDATTILTATQMEVEVHTAGAMALRDRDTYITIDIPAILGEDRDVFEDRRDQLRDALAMEAVTFLAQPDLRDSKGKSISLAGVEVKVEVDTESSLEDGITMHIALDGGDRKSRNIAA